MEGSGAYMAPEVLLKGVSRSQYLLQPGLVWCKHSHDGPNESALLGVGCVRQIGCSEQPDLAEDVSAYCMGVGLSALEKVPSNSNGLRLYD